MNQLIRRSNYYTCEKGTDGWDFICEYDQGSAERTERRKVGIASSWMDPIQFRAPFDPRKPIPSRAEWRKKTGL
jgi:hypothetical protein